ncbi:MAG: endonuclease domain-containing protein [Burkholderiales bacterium]
MRDAVGQRRARALRNQATETERRLWRFIRLRQLGGHRFRRQVPIGCYIADFACLEAKRVVELDGGQHHEQRAHDALRDGYIKPQGFRVLRFWNNQVLQETAAALEDILRALEDPHPFGKLRAGSSLPPEAGEGSANAPSPPPRAPHKGERFFPPPVAGEGQGRGSGDED